MSDLNTALATARQLAADFASDVGVGRRDLVLMFDLFRNLPNTTTMWAFREKRTGRTLEIPESAAALAPRKGWELVSRLATEWQPTDPPENEDQS